MSRIKAALIFLIIGITASITACLHDSEAHSGPTAAEVQRMINDAVAPLQQRIAELETRINDPRDTVYSPGESGAFGKYAKTSHVVDIGTLVATIPSEPFTPQRYTILSPNGYMYGVSNITADNVLIDYLAGPGLSPDGAIYFESPDCTGQAYVLEGQFTGRITRDAARQGIVFRLGAGQFNSVVDDPNQYYYVPKDSASAEITALSRKSKLEECEVLQQPITWAAFEAFVNDPAVTGVESMPIPGPLNIGPAG